MGDVLAAMVLAQAGNVRHFPSADRLISFYGRIAGQNATQEKAWG